MRKRVAKLLRLAANRLDPPFNHVCEYHENGVTTVFVNGQPVTYIASTSPRAIRFKYERNRFD